MLMDVKTMSATAIGLTLEPAAKLMNFINREDPKAFVTIYNVSSMQYQPKI